MSPFVVGLFNNILQVVGKRGWPRRRVFMEIVDERLVYGDRWIEYLERRYLDREDGRRPGRMSVGCRSGVRSWVIP
jgi:hypothetical protein